MRRSGPDTSTSSPDAIPGLLAVGDRQAFTWRGGREDWPDWLVFTNHAWGPERLVIHVLEGTVEARPGDTIHRDAVGNYAVTAGRDA